MGRIGNKIVGEKPLNTNPKDNQKIFSVSVGIPAYNEKGRIGLLLGQVLRENHSTVSEIVLNISGSTDGTREEALSVIKDCDSGHLIKVIESDKRKGKASALDEILRSCSSDILIFLDGDVKLHSGCFDEILYPFFCDDSVGVVSGNVASLNNDEEKLFSFISRFEREIHHELCLDLMYEGTSPKVNGTFFAVRTDVIDDLPQYVVSDDEYVSWSAQKRGYRVVYAPKALVYTKDPENFRDYVAKRRRIFAGHFLIKRTMGYSVPTTRFSKVIPKLLNFSLRKKSQIANVFVMLVMQSVAYILAVSDVILGKTPYRYRVESAKF